MTSQIPERATVKLKLRNNRTRERIVELVEVPAPEPGDAQAAQLKDLVEERWPGAELRVFHDGAASFTRDELHVVAVYVAGTPAGHRRSGSADARRESRGTRDLRLTG